MIVESEIDIRAATCCATNARIGEMSLDAEYEATITRTGGGPLVKWNYRFRCLHCGELFNAYAVCGRDDWPPLAEYVDTGKAVSAGEMSRTFAGVKL